MLRAISQGAGSARFVASCGHRGQENLVNIARSPAFGRIVALDDRMTGGVKMFGGATVGRVVAAADMAAGVSHFRLREAITDYPMAYIKGHQMRLACLKQTPDNVNRIWVDQKATQADVQDSGGRSSLGPEEFEC